ncbi:MAG: hypothetical protein R3B72_42235 [Polyangiaceae bacterium]
MTTTKRAVGLVLGVCLVTGTGVVWAQGGPSGGYVPAPEDPPGEGGAAEGAAPEDGATVEGAAVEGAAVEGAAVEGAGATSEGAEAAAVPAPTAEPADDKPSALRPSSKPWFADFGIGPNIVMLVCGGGSCFSGGVAQFKLEQLIGVHPGGDGEGFGIGLDLQEIVGSGLFRFQPGVRLWGDIRLTDDYGIYISPYGQLGYALYTAAIGSGGSGSLHFFNWQVGVGGKFVINDLVTVGFNPVGFDFSANDQGMIMAYDLSFRVGVTF